MRGLKVEDERGKTDSYVCAHWKTFPPIGAGENAESLRSEKTITQAQYNQLKVWENVCGLTAMEPGKCLGCPHVRKIVWKTRGPYMVTPEGVEVPVVDPAMAEATPNHSHYTGIFRKPGSKGSGSHAAWVKD